jgi:hypothetical protein
MIPPFFENGYLPPGLHPATIEEVAQRFGQESELRRVQMESVRWMIDLAVRAGAERVVLNGSFVTDIMEPNDVDCVLLMGQGPPIDLEAEEALDAGLPFLDIAMVGQRDFDHITTRTFATDRYEVLKGMVEVML